MSIYERALRAQGFSKIANSGPGSLFGTRFDDYGMKSAKNRRKNTRKKPAQESVFVNSREDNLDLPITTEKLQRIQDAEDAKMRAESASNTYPLFSDEPQGSSVDNSTRSDDGEPVDVNLEATPGGVVADKPERHYTFAPGVTVNVDPATGLVTPHKYTKLREKPNNWFSRLFGASPELVEEEFEGATQKFAEAEKLANLYNLLTSAPALTVGGGALGAGLGALIAGRNRRLLGAGLGALGGSGLGYLAHYLERKYGKVADKLFG